MREVARHPLLAELEDDLLGAVDEVRDLAGALLAEPRDLLARPDEPAQRRHLLDDAGVVLDVRGRGDESGELGHLRLPADGLELAPLVELVRERDRVHRLALPPQAERRPEDLRVTLAVEVRGREDLADRSDRGRRESIAPRTDSSASRFWGGTIAPTRSGTRLNSAELIGVGVKPARRTASSETPVSGGVQGERNIRSYLIPCPGRPVDSDGRVVQPETSAPAGNSGAQQGCGALVTVPVDCHPLARVLGLARLVRAL